MVFMRSNPLRSKLIHETYTNKNRISIPRPIMLRLGPNIFRLGWVGYPVYPFAIVNNKN